MKMADARSLVSDALAWRSVRKAKMGLLEPGCGSLSPALSKSLNAPHWSCPPHLHVAPPSSAQGHHLKEFPHSSLPEGKSPPVYVQSLCSVSVNVHRLRSYREERFSLAQGREDFSLRSACLLAFGPGVREHGGERSHLY